MKTFWVTILLIASTKTMAGNWSSDIYKNLREGTSQYISSYNQLEIKTFLKVQKIWTYFKRLSIDRIQIDVPLSGLALLKMNLIFKDIHQIEVAILAMRSLDWIDDMTVSLLLKSLNLTPSPSLPASINQLTNEQESTAMTIFHKWNESLKLPQNCQEDVYRSLISELQRSDASLVKNIKHLNHLAYNKNIISKNTFKQFELFRQQKAQQWPTTLFHYGETLAALSKHFPNRIKDSSQIVTQVRWKQKIQ